MSQYEFPYVVSLVLEDSSVARPDGAVCLAIDGREWLAKVGASGQLDFDSIRVEDLASTLSDVPVQFIPDADFDPVTRPVGRLCFRLCKYTWEDRTFPRSLRVRFDRMRDGGKKPWARTSGDQPGETLRLRASPGAVEVVRAGGETALGWTFPPGRKPGLHPLATPAGQIVTHTMPRDHTWHRGVWFAWTDIACDGVDMPGYAAWTEPHRAVIRDRGLSDLISGPVLQGFTSDSTWCTPDGEPLLDVRWRTEFQTVDAGWNWTDLTLDVTAIRDGISLGSNYGHLTARAAMDLVDSYMLDSAADAQMRETDRADTETDWAGFAGRKPDGRAVSLLMLNHPDNPPGRPRRDYFYEKRMFPIESGSLFIAMSMNPIRGRPMRLEKGVAQTWRYRVVTSDRLLTTDFGQYQYQHWSTPWRVRVDRVSA